MSSAVPRLVCRGALPGSSSAALASSSSRLLGAPGGEQRDAEARVRLGIVRRELDGLAKRGQGVVGLAQNEQRAAELGVRGRELRDRA